MQVSIRLSKEQEEFLNTIRNSSTCSRYCVVKGIFEMGILAVAVMPEFKEKLLEKFAADFKVNKDPKD